MTEWLQGTTLDQLKKNGGILVDESRTRLYSVSYATFAGEVELPDADAVCAALVAQIEMRASDR